MGKDPVLPFIAMGRRFGSAAEIARDTSTRSTARDGTVSESLLNQRLSSLQYSNGTIASGYVLRSCGMLYSRHDQHRSA